MNATFQQLADNAAAVNASMAVTYATMFRDDAGNWAIAGDENTEFNAAYDDYVESLKWFAPEDLKAVAISADGTSQDVTYDMVEEMERLMELRA